MLASHNCVKEVQEQGWHHKGKEGQYVMGLQKLKGTKLIREPFHPIVLEGWSRRPGKQCPLFPLLLALYESHNQSSPDATGRRLWRRLVKMQVGFYPGGVLWWNDWNQNVKKLILKKKKKLFRKRQEGTLDFFLEVFNGVNSITEF